MKIELVGIPGSGKTSIIDALNESNLSLKYASTQGACKRMSNKYFIFVLMFRYIYFFIHPVWFKIWTSLDSMSLKVILPGFLLMNFFSRKKEQGIVIFDEAMLQKGYSIFHNNKELSKKYFSFFLEEITLPDVVIYLNIDSELAYSRIKQRGQFPKRLESISCDEQLLDLELGKIWLDNAIKKIEAKGVSVISFYSSRNMDVLLEDIKLILKSSDKKYIKS